jgi:transcriptional regulator with XRE-family HTH domain
VRGVSQRELAERAGVPRSTLDRIEAGTTDPRLSTVTRLLAAVGFELLVTNEHGRPLRIDVLRETLVDGRGRRFPPHWEYEPITGNWDDNWWGHYRNAIRNREWQPTHTYWRRYPSLLPPWDDAT